MTDLPEFVALLEKGDDETVMTTLLALDAGDRKTLGVRARRWFTEGTTARVPYERMGLAVLATADGERQAGVVVEGWHLGPEFVDGAATLLAARRPSWLPGFVTLLVRAAGNPLNWQLARRLVRDGLAAAPEDPEYFLGTIVGVPDGYAQRQGLRGRLEADPGLIGPHLLTMLTFERGGRRLTQYDSWGESPQPWARDQVASPADTWRQTLVGLAEDGRLDRDALIDVVLAAPLRDWPHVDLVWFVRLHEALAVTVAEVAARQRTYARLLAAGHGPSVKLAQQAFTRLLGEPVLDPDSLVAASAVPLGRPEKATVLAQLRLLEKLAKTHRPEGLADSVRVALDHPKADVRERAEHLLVSLGETGPAEAAPTTFAPPSKEPFPVLGPVTPVADADELVQVLLGLLEEVDAVELERAVDGLLRLADERPATAGVLERRLAAQQPLYADDPRTAPLVLASAWLTPRHPAGEGEWPVVLGFSSSPDRVAGPGTAVGALGRRLTGVAQTLRRGPVVAVGLPSTADGAIDSEALSRRLSGAGRGADDLEVALALLRVSPARRTSVRIPLAFADSQAVTDVREMPPPVWVREVVLGGPAYAPKRKVPLFRDEGASGRGRLDGFLSRSAPAATLDAELDHGNYEARFEHTLALLGLHLPHDLDVLAAHAHPYLERDLHKAPARSVPVLDALARSRVPIGDPEASALVLGLAAQDVRARTAAADALLDLARHGVLDGPRLGTQAAAHLRDGIVIGGRVSRGLTDVTTTDDAAVLPVLDALAVLLDVLPGRRDAGPFLELAADLAERTGRRIPLPQAFRDLATGRSSSQLARAARRLGAGT